MCSLSFYTRQSEFTDPGKFSYLYKELPSDINKIRSNVQSLLLHFWDGDLFGYHIPLQRLNELDVRYVNKMLKRLMIMNNGPLKEPRSLDQRLVVSCRDYAVLLCSILKYHRIPARTRVGFSSVYYQGYNHDQVVVQYWHKVFERWCIIDPRLADLHVRYHNLTIDFDPLDVPPDKFILAGDAWYQVRKNPKIAHTFLGRRASKLNGLWYVRDRLIQDFAALNSIEMLLWDVWGLMLEEKSITQTQLKYLDFIASLTLDPDKHFHEIRSYYHNDSNLTVPNTILSYSPVSQKREVVLNGPNAVYLLPTTTPSFQRKLES